jgi:hypothetical protein
MRRSMVIGAVILAVLAVVGIGVAAFNAGVDEGISRELAQSGDTDRVVRVVAGTATGGATAAGSASRSG